MKNLPTITETTVQNVMRHSTLLTSATMIVLMLTVPAAAALTVTNYTEGSGMVQRVAAIQPSLTGATMAGAIVSVGQGTSGLTETINWTATGPTSGGAVGSMLGWRLSLSGDSGGNPLVLESLGSNGIDWMEIDLMPKLQIGAFDDTEPSPGTPGSVGGTNPWTGIDAAASRSSLGWDIDVAYKDAVTLTGSFPQKDLYRRMRIDFSRPFVGEDILVFLADSDGVRPVPEPATFMLLGMGGLIIGCCLNRRRR